MAPAAPAGASGSRIRLSPEVGPPTTTVSVTGEGFGPSETVDLAFDTQAAGTASTDPSGSFMGSAKVPASALPGPHTVAATGETSGLTGRAPFLVRTDWPMFRYGHDHTGLNPYEKVLSAENVGGLEVGWTFSTSDLFRCAPAVVGGRLFVCAGGTLYAVDAATGARLWSFRAPYSLFASPAVWHHTVYVGTDRGVVYALDAATGVRLWRYATGGPIWSGLTVAGGVVYASASTTGSVFALDARTGARLWESPDLGPDVIPSPALAGGVLYVPSSDNYTLWALDAATGARLWKGTIGYFNESSPAVAGGLVYVGSDNDNLYAFPASGCGHRTCPPVWTATTGGAVQSSPAVAYGLVFVGSGDDSIYGFDAATGAEKWMVQTGDYVGFASAAVANGLVYIGGADGVVRAIDALSGQVLWTYTTGGGVVLGPAVVNGWVYAPSVDLTFYAFHLPE